VTDTGTDTDPDEPVDELAERIEHWIREHPSRAYVERFPVEDVRAALAERADLRALATRLATDGGFDSLLEERFELMRSGAQDRGRATALAAHSEQLADERRQLRDKLAMETRRADRLKAERDEARRGWEITRQRLDTVRALAAQIQRCVEWPGIEDTTYPEIVKTLRHNAAQLVNALLDPAEVLALVHGAEQRLQQPGRPDDPDEIRARLDRAAEG
jgi:hypothetical protein